MSAAGLFPGLGPAVLAAGSWAEAVLARLVGASLAGALAVALVALAVRLAPRLPPAFRAALWWLACLKLLLSLLPLPTLALPLPTALSARLLGADAISSRLPGLAAPSVSRGDAAPARIAALSSLPPPAQPFPWRPVGAFALVALWAAGLTLGARDSARQLAAARRILRGARPTGSPALAVRFAELSAKAGLSRPPALLVSAEVETPVAVACAAGLGAPAVVIPAGLARAEHGRNDELDMALCHELAHVRRGDLRLGWVPAFAARLFFFHPFARLAAREHALAREAACDAFVLARLAAPPAAYARLLLAMGAAGRLSGVAALDAAPPPGTLKRRLLMLDSTPRRPRPAVLALAGLAALVALLPVHIASPAAAAVTRAAPVGAVNSAADTGVRAHARKPQSADAYMLVSKNVGIGTGGTSADVALAGQLARGGPVFWFRRDDFEYVVRDPALLARMDELLSPQWELSRKERELGARQAELLVRQRKLGAKQGALGSRLGSLAPRGASAARERDALSRQMAELGDRQQALGRRQEEFVRQQQALFREQERASREADAKLKPLLDDAVVRGFAQQVR